MTTGFCAPTVMALTSGRLGHVQVRRAFEVEHPGAVPVAGPQVGDLVLADAHGVAEQHLPEPPLVAEVTESPHELVHQGDRLQCGGGGPVRRVLVRLGAHALVAKGGIDRHGAPYRRAEAERGDRPRPVPSVGRSYDALRRLAGLAAPATAASSSSRVIFDRPGMPSSAARDCSSALLRRRQLARGRAARCRPDAPRLCRRPWPARSVATRAWRCARPVDANAPPPRWPATPP